MSATDELRAELTKRGVEWWPMHDIEAGYYQDRDTEFVFDGKKYTAHEWGSRLTVYGLTPAQAIAATLWRRTCHKVRVHMQIEDEMHCSECGRFLGFAGDVGAPPCNYCPNCGRRVVKVDE